MNQMHWLLNVGLVCPVLTESTGYRKFSYGYHNQLDEIIIRLIKKGMCAVYISRIAVRCRIGYDEEHIGMIKNRVYIVKKKHGVDMPPDKQELRNKLQKLVQKRAMYKDVAVKLNLGGIYAVKMWCARFGIGTSKKRLTDRAKLILAMHYKGMSNADIAKRMGTSLDSIRLSIKLYQDRGF